ncbi:hypothetical protein [Microbacterium sp. MYb72]|uniref:hypothetical protein n=1 Tax=Microbacterium sp. MYb72 TaxID=1848693 RepID=UPI0011AFEF38|nr:hypothetical protein [Microbacterium sp. MYb72]
MTRRWRDAVLPTIGLVAAAVAVSWTITFSVPVVVPTASDTADVAFGWPLPWYHQDLSRFAYVDHPVEVTVVGDRADPVPTSVDWLAFSGNVALTALVLWPIALVLIRGLARLVLRARENDAPTGET